MTKSMNKSLDKPDETITEEYPQAKAELLHIGNWNVYHLTMDPGWRLSKHAGPMLGTETCQDEHPLWMVLSGRFAVQMDGKKVEFGPGDVGYLLPGYDAWVIGDEPVIAIDLQPQNPKGS